MRITTGRTETFGPRTPSTMTFEITQLSRRELVRANRSPSRADHPNRTLPGESDNDSILTGMSSRPGAIGRKRFRGEQADLGLAPLEGCRTGCENPRATASRWVWASLPPRSGHPRRWDGARAAGDEPRARLAGLAWFPRRVHWDRQTGELTSGATGHARRRPATTAAVDETSR